MRFFCSLQTSVKGGEHRLYRECVKPMSYLSLLVFFLNSLRMLFLQNQLWIFSVSWKSILQEGSQKNLGDLQEVAMISPANKYSIQWIVIDKRIISNEQEVLERIVIFLFNRLNRRRINV